MLSLFRRNPPTAALPADRLNEHQGTKERVQVHSASGFLWKTFHFFFDVLKQKFPNFLALYKNIENKPENAKKLIKHLMMAAFYIMATKCFTTTTQVQNNKRSLNSYIN